MPCPQAAQRSYAHLHHRSPRLSFWVPRCPDVRIYVVYNTDGGCGRSKSLDLILSRFRHLSQTFFCVCVRAIDPWAVHHSSDWAVWWQFSFWHHRTARASRRPSCPSDRRVQRVPRLVESPQVYHRSFVHCSIAPFGFRIPNLLQYLNHLCVLSMNEYVIGYLLVDSTPYSTHCSFCANQLAADCCPGKCLHRTSLCVLSFRQRPFPFPSPAALRRDLHCRTARDKSEILMNYIRYSIISSGHVMWLKTTTTNFSIKNL